MKPSSCDILAASMTPLRRLLRFLRLFEAAPDAVPLPLWELRPPARSELRLHVLWTGSQVAPVPILIKEQAPRV